MKLPLAALLVAGLVAGGLASAQDKGKMEKKKAGAKSVTVRLAAQNKSGQSGRARLTAMGEDKTKVDITMKPGPKGVAQPAHIHEGACPKPNPKPKHGLQDVVDGKSSSEVPVSLDTLLKEKLAINVHKSKEEVKVYVACGNIARAGGASKKKMESSKKMDK